MRRLVPGLVAAGALAVGVAFAWAAPATIHAGMGGANVFNPAAPNNHEAGTVATMAWEGGGGSHNVTASTNGLDGKALFRSATIGGGSTPVNGTQFIGVGSYAFSCTVHPGMTGTLTVNSGSPLPKPAVTLKILSKTLGGKIKAKVTSASPSGAPGGEILAKLGKTKLTKDATFSVGAGGSSTIKLKLSSAGKNKLSGRSSARIKVTGTPDFGSPVTKKKTLR